MSTINAHLDRHSILDEKSIPVDSFYISNPSADPDSLLYQLNRAGSLFRFPPQFLISRDREYPFTAIVCVLDGYGTVTMNGKNYALEPNEVMILPPYTEYSYHSLEKDPFSIVWVEFCGGDSMRLVQNILDTHGPCFYGELFNTICDNCRTLAHPPQFQRSLWISRMLYENLLQLTDASASAQLRQEESFYSILDYIDQHLSENLTLARMAQVYNYNASYFSRFFYQSTGIHFAHYLLRRRLALARHLLLSTNLPLDQLSQETGFYDASHFVRKFREAEGISPSRFRRIHTGKISGK